MRRSLLVTLATTLFAGRAAAQQAPVSVPETTPPVNVGPVTKDDAPPPDKLDDATMPDLQSYWARGDARPFVSTTIDAGYLYLRPRASFGYGKPFWKWIGVDLNPQVAQTFLGGYAGIRAAIPFVEFRAGARYVWAFQKQFLLPNSSYDRLALEARETERSQYLASEAEITATIPVGFGAILATGSLSYLTGVPKEVKGVPLELRVYDETLRVIIEPPWVWRTRLGYAVRLGREGRVSLGVVADFIGLPGRHREIVRAGIVGTAALSDHLEVLGSFVPPVFSPDAIGFAGGDFGQLGLRYRWASGQAPETPPPREPRKSQQASSAMTRFSGGMSSIETQ